MTPESHLAILIEKLRLPSAIDLEPWLKRLIDNPNSMVIIAIEKPLSAAPHIGTAWLSAKERRIVRQALQRMNTSRQKKGEQQTNELPQ